MVTTTTITTTATTAITGGGGSGGSGWLIDHFKQVQCLVLVELFLKRIELNFIEFSIHLQVVHCDRHCCCSVNFSTFIMKFLLITTQQTECSTTILYFDWCNCFCVEWEKLANLIVKLLL
ncbi:hypothetical protein T4D_4549 [Trichinella pseudospiralis]|uniref:Uncharacterized protein n=1 Tax=Trichinella pseudospiralis TaxID=6337 RepID=A0A0V1FF46_TRIPS|nr:hypothetical protein T4D_11175 [Trichinella pseudospiralis]KRY84649.1 hypothetical protein T4D_4549 [Trichinella pseudospiralis]